MLLHDMPFDNLLGVFAGTAIYSGGKLESVMSNLVLNEFHASLLQNHNGAALFGGALRVFGITEGVLPGIDNWNDPDGWRAAYGNLTTGLTFFSEDFLGNQFAFDSDKQTAAILHFEAETGRRTEIAGSFVQWLQTILMRPEKHIDCRLLRDWISGGGKLQLNEHLCPTYPFIVRQPSPPKLHTIDRNDSMKFKGDFARQVQHLPDGAPIKFKIID